MDVLGANTGRCVCAVRQIILLEKGSKNEAKLIRNLVERPPPILGLSPLKPRNVTYNKARITRHASETTLFHLSRSLEEAIPVPSKSTTTCRLAFRRRIAACCHGFELLLHISPTKNCRTATATGIRPASARTDARSTRSVHGWQRGFRRGGDSGWRVRSDLQL